MAEKEQEGYLSGKDAAYIKPKLIPNYELLGRDDSGGPDFDPHAAEFGDAGFTTGAKAHLSAKGGSEAPKADDEESKAARRKAS